MNPLSPSRKAWIMALAAFVLVVTIILIAMFVLLRGRQPENALRNPVSTLPPSSLGISGFREVRGTDFLIASVNETYRTSSSIARESYAESGTVRNLVFLNQQTLESRKLYETNQQVILSSHPFPEPPEASPAIPVNTAQPVTPLPVLPVRSFIIQTVRADGNSDGRLDFEDPFVIAISDAGGGGYQELLTGVTHVYWMKMTGEQYLLIVYQQNGVKQASRIDIGSRTLLDTVPLVGLGEEVK